MTLWDFQNKGKSGWTGTSSFVLEVPLRHLRPSVIYSVPCDRILQRAYYQHVPQSVQQDIVKRKQGSSSVSLALFLYFEQMPLLSMVF